MSHMYGMPKTLRIAVGVLSIVGTLLGAVYATYSFAGEYHEQFAKKEYVAQQMKTTKIETLRVSVRNYEDQLFAISYRISNGQATELDHATKERIERQLADLRQQISVLRSNRGAN